MAYAKKLREQFPGITLHWEDLLLLEAFQVNYLPGRVLPGEFATLIRTYPVLHRFLVSRHPPIASFLADLLKENRSPGHQQEREEQCQEALWEIADLILYNKNPELLDYRAPLKWNLDEITSIVPLEGKVVADVGAGSGRIAFLVAPLAQAVFAVEPVARFRSYMKEKARNREVKKIYVMDGTLDSIPLPDATLEVLITSNAMGWALQDELTEIERVVKSGGHVLHLLSSDKSQDNPFHNTLLSAPWNYNCLQEEDESRIKFRYYRYFLPK